MKKLFFITSLLLCNCFAQSKTIYISGPITSNREYYKECFAAAKEFLQDKGYDVIDPSSEIFDEAIRKAGIEDLKSKEAWLLFLKNDMTLVSESDGIYMLNNWERSGGCNIEYIVAKKFNLPIYYEKEKENVPSINF